jgi:hypothetical protein
VTLLQTAGRSMLSADPRRRLGGVTALLAAAILAAVTAWTWGWSYPNGLAGLLLFTILALLTVAAFALVVGRVAAEPGAPATGVATGAAAGRVGPPVPRRSAPAASSASGPFSARWVAFLGMMGHRRVENPRPAPLTL